MIATRHTPGHVLQAYHDGELPADEAAGVAEHIAACARCRRELAELEEIGRILSDAPSPELPRTVWHRVRPGRTVSARPRLSLAFAAGVAGVLLGVLIGPMRFGEETTDVERSWAETATVWNGGASASLLTVYQTGSE